MNGFYWLQPGGPAGCSRPGGMNGKVDSDESTLRQDLTWLRSRGIGALLSLTEAPLPGDIVTEYDLVALHIPVPDMTAPDPRQITEAIDFIDLQQSLGRPVAVHCRVGQGRTATILAAYLIRGGMTANEAIERLRTLRSGAVSCVEQEDALSAYYRRMDWIV